MKMTIHIDLAKTNAGLIEAKASSKDNVSVFITAADIEQAQELLPQGAKAGQRAAAMWRPKRKRPEPDKHYYLPPVTIEDAEAELIALQKTAEGSKFLKSIEAGHKFTSAKDVKPMTATQARVFALMAYSKGAFDAIFKTYCYAFKKGYTRAQRAAKV